MSKYTVYETIWQHYFYYHGVNYTCMHCCSYTELIVANRLLNF